MNRILKRIAPLAVGALLLFAASAQAADPTDKWVRWVNVPDSDPNRDERSTWVRSLDFIGPLLYAGSEGDGVFTSGFALGPWSAYNGGLEDQAAKKNVREVVAGGGRIYAATSAGLFRAFAAGGSFEPVSQGAGPRRLNMGGIQTVHFNALPTDQDIVVGTASSGVWYSSDFGENWDKASGFPAGESVFDITPNPGVLYAAAAGGVYAAVDLGRSWILASDGIPPSETVLRVAVTPDNPLVLYASTSSGIYKSTNAGVTWDDATGTGEGVIGDDTARALVLGPSQFGGGRLIAGTQDGAWATRDDGATWGQMSPETLVDPDPIDPAPDPLPFGQQIVWALGIGFGGPQGFNLMAGTQASGIYSIALQTLRNRGAPVISPIASVNVGEKLTASTGDWAGTRPYFFRYQWENCVSAVSCSAIRGATAAKYTVTSDDLGDRVRVRVTATNIVSPGSITVTSGMTSAVLADPGTGPRPLTQNTWPSITPSQNAMPTPVWGQRYTIANGMWRVGLDSVDPTFAYQWQRCDGNANNCVDLPGADEASYTTTPADVARKLKAQITATHMGASSTYELDPTATIIEKRPVSTEKPKVVGDPWVGSQLSSSAGAWVANKPSFQRRWLRCNEEGLQCNPTNPVQTGGTYPLTAADRGSRLQLEVTATVIDPNQNRVEVAYSDPSPVITDPPPPDPPAQCAGCGGGGPTPPGPPAPPTPPGRTGVSPRGRGSAPSPFKISVPRRLVVGAKINVPAAFRGFRRPRYQWYRNGKKIRGATRRTYRLTRKDRGKRIVCKITLTPRRGGRAVVRTTPAISVPALRAPRRRR